MCILSDINDPASNYFWEPRLSNQALETFLTQNFKGRNIRRVKREESYIKLILQLVKICNIKHRVWLCVTVIIITR